MNGLQNNLEGLRSSILDLLYTWHQGGIGDLVPPVSFDDNVRFAEGYVRVRVGLYKVKSKKYPCGHSSFESSLLPKCSG
jgi:hypothetical protein